MSWTGKVFRVQSSISSERQAAVADGGTTEHGPLKTDY